MNGRLEGGRELGRLSQQLKQAGNKGLQKQMRKRLKDAMEPVLRDVKGNASQVSSTVAHSIVVRASYTAKSANLRVEASKRRMPPGKENLPKLLEFGSRGSRGRYLRHPVFADPTETRSEWTWVKQPIQPFFYRNAKKHNKTVTREVAKVLDDIDKQINRGIR